MVTDLAGPQWRSVRDRHHRGGSRRRRPAPDPRLRNRSHSRAFERGRTAGEIRSPAYGGYLGRHTAATKRGRDQSLTQRNWLLLVGE